MPTTMDDLYRTFFDELEGNRQRYAVYVHQAEAEGYTQLAKLLRALLASETARGDLIRSHMAAHAVGKDDFAVCPRCGLIYIPEAPEKCPVDDTPGFEFVTIV